MHVWIDSARNNARELWELVACLAVGVGVQLDRFTSLPLWSEQGTLLMKLAHVIVDLLFITSKGSQASSVWTVTKVRMW